MSLSLKVFSYLYPEIQALQIYEMLQNLIIL